MRLNGEGKQLYRQERWDEARAKYEAALGADPGMLAAQLNLACAFSRQGRYGEAAQEAAALIRQAYVPYSREVMEAADLGILQSQPSFRVIQSAQAEAAVAYGAQLADAVFFVARTRPPIGLAGEGSLVLGLSQELFAWIPRTGRYLQVSAEDGRVLAVAVSADRKHAAYVLAGRLVREQGKLPVLRELSVRVLEVPTMTLGPKVALPGDVRQVQLWYAQAPEMRIIDAEGERKSVRLANGEWQPSASAGAGVKARIVVLTTAGVAPSGRKVAEKPGCRFALAPEKDAAGVWRIRVSKPGAKPFVLDTRYGAGLDGLLFP
jgi:hypothetical protein